MAGDLARYVFAAAFADVTGRSPKARDFPAALAPAHGNWTSDKFADRFRVQVAGQPATTVTSHIAKDTEAVTGVNPVTSDGIGKPTRRPALRVSGAALPRPCAR